GGRTHPGPRRARGARRLTVPAARHRAPARPRDRPPGGAGPRTLQARRGGDRDRRRAGDPPPTAARWRLRDVRRPPYGARRGGHRARRARRAPERCRVYRQDVAGIPGTMGVADQCAGPDGPDGPGRWSLTRRRLDYDEDDVRVRPGRTSRPRTRIRPRHEDAAEGFVVAVDRGRYTCDVDGRRVVAMRARELGRRGVVVGDRVSLVGDVSGRPDTLARIVRIGERRSVLRRTADDEASPEGRTERVVVANADQLVIVSSLADPPPRTGFIDRCLVAAYDADIDPLLCLTKADLAGPAEIPDY